MEIIFLIKDYAIGKADEILALENNWKEIGDEAWNISNLLYELPMKWELSHVALHDDIVVGYQIGSLREGNAFLNKIVVDNEKRGLGIGRKLLRAFLEKCTEKNLERIRFRVRTDNPAVEFYDKLKFTKLDGIDYGRADGLPSYFYDSLIRDVLPNLQSKIIPPSKPFINDEDINSVALQVKSGMHATGKITGQFENRLKEYIGAKFAKATTSGTTALHLALKALEIKEGDEVIIPSYVCNSVLHAVNYCGAKAVLADIEDDYFNCGFNISSRTIKPLITENTKVIIVPHLFGIPADLDEILKLNILVIEDCCQSIGASYKGRKTGSMGIIGVYSFYATKVISTGQGGMVVTSDENIKKRIELLTRENHEEPYDIAFNYGLTDIQSALGIKQLEKLDCFIERRKELAKKYDSAFRDCKFKIFNHKDGAFPFRYLIKFDTANEKENFRKALKDKGILIYPNVYRPIHRYLGLDPNKFKNTEEAHETTMYIPCYPALTDEEVDYVIKNVLDVATYCNTKNIVLETINA